MSAREEEIVSSFSLIFGRLVSNGPIEGRNSLIRKVLKLDSGYSDFPRFRSRIINSLNKMADHTFKPKKSTPFLKSIFLVFWLLPTRQFIL